jgi:hypothetical protein
MELLRPAIKEQVASAIEYTTKKQDSYFKDQFWREIETELLRGRSWNFQSDFSLYASIFIGNIVDNSIEQYFDDLIKKALTSPNSIGDYWLKERQHYLLFSVQVDLKEHWKNIIIKENK